MIHVTTTSGAEYLIDGLQAQRLSGPYSPLIDYTVAPNGVWEALTSKPKIEVGERLALFKEGGRFRLSTPIVSVEEKL